MLGREGGGVIDKVPCGDFDQLFSLYRRAGKHSKASLRDVCIVRQSESGTALSNECIILKIKIIQFIFSIRSLVNDRPLSVQLRLVIITGRG